MRMHGLEARETTAKPVPSEVEGMAVPPGNFTQLNTSLRGAPATE